MGVDLGQSKDYTAIAVICQDDKTYTVRHLERMPLGTSYPDVARRIEAIVKNPTLKATTILADGQPF